MASKKRKCGLGQGPETESDVLIDIAMCLCKRG